MPKYEIVTCLGRLLNGMGFSIVFVADGYWNVLGHCVTGL